MQPWQIKALELETSVLKSLDGFIYEHGGGLRRCWITSLMLHMWVRVRFVTRLRS